MQLGHRLVSTRPPDPDAPAALRLVHLSPGLVPLRVHVDAAMESHTSEDVPYGGTSDRLAAPADHALIKIAFFDSPISLIEQQLPTPPGTLTTLYVGPMQGDRPMLLVDTTR